MHFSNFTMVSPETAATETTPKCSVWGCDQDAGFEVLLYDVYPHEDFDVFFEQHEFCPFICQKHLSENERGAKTGLRDPQSRQYRGTIDYPHTRSFAQGFVIYRPLT